MGASAASRRCSSSGRAVAAGLAVVARAGRQPSSTPTTPDDGDVVRLERVPPSSFQRGLDPARLVACTHSRVPHAYPLGQLGVAADLDRRRSRRSRASAGAPARGRGRPAARGAGPARPSGARCSRRASSAALAWARSTAGPGCAGRAARARPRRARRCCRSAGGGRAAARAGRGRPRRPGSRWRRGSTSEWPDRYLVTECTTTSAPCVQRALAERRGEGVVDHDEGARRPRRAATSAGRSATSSSGFVGVSTSSIGRAGQRLRRPRRCRSGPPRAAAAGRVRPRRAAAPWSRCRRWSAPRPARRRGPGTPRRRPRPSRPSRPAPDRPPARPARSRTRPRWGSRCGRSRTGRPRRTSTSARPARSWRRPAGAAGRPAATASVAGEYGGLGWSVTG